MIEGAHNQRRAIVAQPFEIEPFHPLSSRGILDVAGRSVRGKLHTHNSDHYLAVRVGRVQETLISSLASSDLPAHFEEHAYCLLVADGRGRRGAGARASRIALSALAHLAIRYGKWHVRVDSHTAANIREQFEFFTRQAHDVLFEARQDDAQLFELTTGLTAVYIAGTDLFAMSVGTSKALLLRGEDLVQVTTNGRQRRLGAGRSVPARAPDDGHTDPMLVGVEPDAVQIEQLQLRSGDRLLLCTKGLIDFVSEDEIAETLASRRNLDEQCRELIDRAVAAGSADDVTVVIADYRLRTR
jgi:protein phosphatase